MLDYRILIEDRDLLADEHLRRERRESVSDESHFLDLEFSIFVYEASTDEDFKETMPDENSRRQRFGKPIKSLVLLLLLRHELDVLVLADHDEDLEGHDA